MKKITSLLIIILLMTGSLWAQTGSIRGKIIEKSTKKPLPGANITIVGTTQGAASDGNGNFIIENVDECICKLKVTFLGYHSFIKPDVRVIRNKVTLVEEIQLTEQSIEGEAVTITAGVFQEDKETPVSNFTFTRDEIFRNPGSGGDIFRAIGTIPGVSSSGGEFSAFSVRGGSPQENILLVDNIPFDKLTHFEGSGNEDESTQGGRFSVFTPNLIEEAQFQAGGFPARFGGKYSSILRLKVKEGNRDNITLNGTYDLFGWETNYSGPLPLLKNTSTVVSARHQDLKKIFKMIGEEADGYPEYSDLIFKTTTEINSQNKVSILGIYADESFTRTIENVYKTDDLFDNALLNHTDTKSLLGLNWRILTSSKSYLMNTIYYYDDAVQWKDGEVLTDPQNGELPTAENAIQRHNLSGLNSDEYNMGVKSEFTLCPNNHSTILTGLEMKYTDYNFALRLASRDTFYTFDKYDYRPDVSQKFLVYEPEMMNTDNSLTATNFSGYAEYSYRLANLITLNPGVRYDLFTQNSKNYFSPRFSVSYQLAEKTTVNGATGLYYQTPSYKMLASNEQNKNLENEKAYHFIFGVNHYLSDNYKISIEGYYKKMENILVRPNRTEYTMENTGDGWASGIDFSLVKRFVNKSYGQISYSYCISKRDDNNGEGEYYADFHRPHVFNILAGYQFNKEWSLSAKWFYLSGRPQDSYIVHRNVHNDESHLRYSKEITDNNGSRFPATHALNIRLDYRKQIHSLGIIAFIDILNLYDHKNYVSEEFISRSGENKLIGFGMLPTFGFKLEL